MATSWRGQQCHRCVRRRPGSDTRNLRARPPDLIIMLIIMLTIMLLICCPKTRVHRRVAVLGRRCCCWAVLVAHASCDIGAHRTPLSLCKVHVRYGLYSMCYVRAGFWVAPVELEDPCACVGDGVQQHSWQHPQSSMQSSRGERAECGLYGHNTCDRGKTQ